MTELAGRHILVTGATGGLGSRVVRQLLAAGAKVSLAGRDEVTLNAPVSYTHLTLPTICSV